MIYRSSTRTNRVCPCHLIINLKFTFYEHLEYSIARHSRNHFPLVKAGDCFGQDPRNDTGYVFDDMRYVVIASDSEAILLLSINGAF
ncbi:MAG: hypothetical protein E3K33_08245 [Candidatus Brocadia sp.]|nr:hypothetical protein [Candidatus Brocadia sp.]